jgi:DNA modification methylase
MTALLNGRLVLHGGDNRLVLRATADNSVDSVVTDPPYALVSVVKRFGNDNAAPAKGNEAFVRASKGFMGKTWDTGEVSHDVEFWKEILRVLKPGGHLVTFGGTRTNHRQVCAIEDAGFEIRDMLAWLYGTGFPKSHDVSKGIDRAAGVEREKTPTVAMQRKGDVGEISKNVRCAICGKARASGNPCICPRIEDVPVSDEAAQWEGWGTALKPAIEPICLARKPLSEKTVAANVLKWGTGAINVDGCRVGTESTRRANHGGTGDPTQWRTGNGGDFTSGSDQGRFPANVLHDGSDEVVSAFPSPHGAGAAREEPGGGTYDGSTGIGFAKGGKGMGVGLKGFRIGDSGSAARFFYSAKASKRDRAGSKHPTVKPINPLRWLCRLVTPPGGTVLDPFAGSGTTGEAALLEGFNCIMIERESEYLADIFNRFVSYGDDTPSDGAIYAAVSAANDNDTQIDLEEAIAAVAA